MDFDSAVVDDFVLVVDDLFLVVDDVFLVVADFFRVVDDDCIAFVLSLAFPRAFFAAFAFAAFPRAVARPHAFAFGFLAVCLVFLSLVVDTMLAGIFFDTTPFAPATCIVTNLDFFLRRLCGLVTDNCDTDVDELELDEDDEDVVSLSTSS